MRSIPFSTAQFDLESIHALIAIQLGTTTLRFTSYHSTLTVGGDDYIAAPGALVTNLQFPSDGTPATADVVIMATTGGVIAPGDATRGRLDNWPITISIVDVNNLSDGAFDMIPSAVIGNVTEDTRGMVRLSVNGPLSTTAKVVTEHFALTCRADLYDDRCKVVRADFTGSTTGQATSSFVITFDSLPDARASDSTWYVEGLISFTSGPLLGYPDKPIRAWDPGTLEATLFLPVSLTDVPAGTAMDVSAGCDLTREMCFSRFDNIVNLRAETFVPPSQLITSF